MARHGGREELVMLGEYLIDAARLPEIDIQEYPVIVWALHGATCLAELAEHPSIAIERVSSRQCSQLGFTSGCSQCDGWQAVGGRSSAKHVLQQALLRKTRSTPQGNEK